MVGVVEIGGVALFSIFASFLLFYYYWSIDKKSESFDGQCREAIENHPEFRALEESSYRTLIVTSDSRTSKARASILKLQGKLNDKPDKIIPLYEHSSFERNKALIQEHCRNIPGRNIIDPDLVSCIRTYFAYKMALKLEGSSSDLVLHFKEEFEKHQHSNRVFELGKAENYPDIDLGETREVSKNPLDDVFLVLLRGAENHCVRPLVDLDRTEMAIERCRKFMMSSFWRLYKGDMVGTKVLDASENEECVRKFRVDARDNDNVAYWILTENNCSSDLFEKFKNVGWGVSLALDDYWGEGNYFKLHPGNDAIPRMDHVVTPFIIFRKNLEEFRGGPNRKRIKEDPRYRRKEEHARQ